MTTVVGILVNSVTGVNVEVVVGVILDEMVGVMVLEGVENTVRVKVIIGVIVTVELTVNVLVTGVSIQEQAVLAISFAIPASADNFDMIGNRLSVDVVVRPVGCVLVNFTLLDGVLIVEVDVV